jgi:hypothetical protein
VRYTKSIALGVRMDIDGLRRIIDNKRKIAMFRDPNLKTDKRGVTAIAA